MNLHVGTSGYAYKEWKGTFYPADLPANLFLPYYGGQFRAVEINNTFYGPPKPNVLEGWAKDVPAGFRFALKAPQKITHIKRLKEAGDEVSQLFEAAAVLKARFGPVLFQLPPNMKKDAARLNDFLALLPSRTRAAFEFRHPSWFDDEVFGVLRKHKVALCIADADDELQVPFAATTSWGYLRLRRAEYTEVTLKSWAGRIREQDWKDAFVFFKHEDTGTGPRYAKTLLELLG